jgi:large subunit ribosomal protein L20
LEIGNYNDMPRVKRGVGHVKKRKKLLAKTKGYRWGRKKQIRAAKIAVLKAGVHSYVDRRKKKRVNRGLQNIRISAFVKEYGLSYSKFIDALKKSKIGLDRKILSDLAQNNKEVLAKIIEQVKKKGTK